MVWSIQFFFTKWLYKLVDRPCESSIEFISEHAYIEECIHLGSDQVNFFDKVLI